MQKEIAWWVGVRSYVTNKLILVTAGGKKTTKRFCLIFLQTLSVRKLMKKLRKCAVCRSNENNIQLFDKFPTSYAADSFNSCVCI